MMILTTSIVLIAIVGGASGHLKVKVQGSGIEFRAPSVGCRVWGVGFRT